VIFHPIGESFVDFDYFCSFEKSPVIITSIDMYFLKNK